MVNPGGTHAVFLWQLPRRHRRPDRLRRRRMNGGHPHHGAACERECRVRPDFDRVGLQIRVHQRRARECGKRAHPEQLAHADPCGRKQLAREQLPHDEERVKDRREIQRVERPDLLREPGEARRTERQRWIELLRDSKGEPSGISILSKRVGRSTALLYDTEPGRAIPCLGPLGRPFSLVDPPTDAWMVAGGVGLAPFATLAEALAARGVRQTLFYGARRAEELFYLDFFRALGVDLVLTTEDGSIGERGRISG